MLERPGNPVFGIDNRGLITFSDVCLKIDNHPLIKNINCKLTSHGKTVVMGPNGAGKSLFLRLLAGLLKPTKGTISLTGVLKQEENEPNLAILFQHPVLLRRNAFQNIEYVMRRYKHLRSNLAENVGNVLAQARLGHLAKSSARALSGGERQRLALARALAIRPKILLMDEVTASLDPASMHIVEKMSEQAAANGTKIIFITHDIRQAKRIADDILFIHQGCVLTHMPAKEFFIEPGSHEAQAYLDGRVP